MSRRPLLRRLAIGGGLAAGLAALAGTIPPQRQPARDAGSATMSPSGGASRAARMPRGTPHSASAGEIIPVAAAAPARETPIDDHAADDHVATIRQLCTGCWRLHSHGERTITLAEDGTATMIVRLDAIGAFLYGNELQFDMDWELDGEELTYRFTGGQPAATVAQLTRLFGKEHHYRIALINDKTLELVPLNDESAVERWTAIALSTP